MLQSTYQRTYRRLVDVLVSGHDDCESPGQLHQDVDGDLVVLCTGCQQPTQRLVMPG